MYVKAETHIFLIGKSVRNRIRRKYDKPSGALIIYRITSKKILVSVNLSSPYRKPTQVVKERILRRSEDSWLRN